MLSALALATFLAQASPSPLASPSAVPSPAVSAAPVHALLLDRGSIGIAPGATASVGVGGATGTVTATASFPGVSARYDAAMQRVVLTATAAGRGTVTLTDTTGATATLSVLVAPPAGVVPPAITVELGGNVTHAFAVAQIRDALDAAAQLRPGARLAFQAPGIPDALAPGASLDLSAAVHVDGGGTYLDADGTADVHVVVDAVTPFDPTTLFYSDDPEYVNADGVVFRSTTPIDAAHPGRAYIYHATAAGGRRLWLVIGASGAPSRVQLLGSDVGPSQDYGCVGHTATARYLAARRSEESRILNVAANAPAVVALDETPLGPQDLVNAVFDLRVLSGGPIGFAVVSTSGEEDPRAVAAGAPLPGDGHGRRGEYALSAVHPLALTYTVPPPGGDPGDEDPSFTIGLGSDAGAIEFPNLLPGGRSLVGDYGVLRPVSLTIANPTPQPQTIWLDELASSGPATTTFWFTGDPQPTELPQIAGQSTAYAVRAFTVPPNATQTVTGVYMTDGASSFPVEFGLTATPPPTVAPTACIP